MFILTAPHNLPTDITVLPNPEWEDTQAQQLEVSLRRSMNNVVYTYVKRKNKRKLDSSVENQRYKFNYIFVLERLKALEMIAFIEMYYKERIRWEDHKGNVWAGFVVNDPVTFESIQINEVTKIELQLEGVQI